MIYKHLLLELYCEVLPRNSGIPDFCISNGSEIGVHCLENGCSFMSFSPSPHEICITNEKGIVENIDDFIGFGGEMDANLSVYYEIYREILLSVWSSICQKKIQESYHEYMEKRNNYP